MVFSAFVMSCLSVSFGIPVSLASVDGFISKICFMSTILLLTSFVLVSRFNPLMQLVGCMYTFKQTLEGIHLFTLFFKFLRSAIGMYTLSQQTLREYKLTFIRHVQGITLKA